jgi:hypothetical protein
MEGATLAGPEIGMQGTITIATRGQNGPGEVQLPVDGGSGPFIAYSDDVPPSGASVVVIEIHPSRKVDVAPLA